MRRSVFAGALATLLLSPIAGVIADPGDISLPQGYADEFVPYATTDKRDRKPNVVRVMYIDPKAADGVQPGESLPEGTRIVMAEHVAEQGVDGQTLFNRDGRMIPTDTVSTIFVAEKRAGIGDKYDEALQNGDWEFAVFQGDGSRKADVDFKKCRECHRQAIRTDYTFSVFPNLDAIIR